MARPEKQHDNREVQKELKKIKFKELSVEAKDAINHAIQGCKSLGRNKVDSEEIYEVLQKCEYITKPLALHTVNMKRASGTISKLQLKGNSQAEKYKLVSKRVSEALELLILQGIPLKNSMRRTLSKVQCKQLDGKQEKELADKVKAGVPINDLIKYLSGLL